MKLNIEDIKKLIREVVFTARGRLALAPTRNRAMNAGLSAGYWLKPYAPFKLTAKNP